MPNPISRVPPFDPFDHSHCHHPRPRWPLEVTSHIQMDLFMVLHEIWKFLMWGNIPAAIGFIEQINYYLIHGALDLGDELDEEVLGQVAVLNDLQEMQDHEAFNAELKKLFERDQNGEPVADEPPASFGNEPDDDDGPV